MKNKKLISITPDHAGITPIRASNMAYKLGCKEGTIHRYLLGFHPCATHEDFIKAYNLYVLQKEPLKNVTFN